MTHHYPIAGNCFVYSPPLGGKQRQFNTAKDPCSIKTANYSDDRKRSKCGNLTLPEVIARDHGNEESENYLGDVAKR